MKPLTRFSETCWTVIREAAEGNQQAAEEFARMYEPAVKAYLFTRWPDPQRRMDVTDATQDVFVECFRPNGVLNKADPLRSGGFRAYLFGVVRHIALRFEARRKPGFIDGDFVADETSLSRSFDRAYARSIMKEASRVQSENAHLKDDAAVRRIELLRLRFQENLPIREIAELWNENPARLHHEYAVAREEFRIALHEVVRFHNPQETDTRISELCVELLGCLK